MIRFLKDLFSAKYFDNLEEECKYINRNINIKTNIVLTINIISAILLVGYFVLLFAIK
jgi:hypothetical protein